MLPAELVVKRFIGEMAEALDNMVQSQQSISVMAYLSDGEEVKEINNSKGCLPLLSVYLQFVIPIIEDIHTIALYNTAGEIALFL